MPLAMTTFIWLQSCWFVEICITCGDVIISASSWLLFRWALRKLL